MFVRVSPSHGVRRRREDNVEIEELDSRRTPASRKRQRTLAEQLDDLCLQGPLKNTKNKNRNARRRVKDSRIVELDEFGQDKPPSMDGSGSDSDGMMDTTGTNSQGIKVYGDVETVGGLRSFFAAGAGERHGPMDLMYRHYVAVAQAATTTPPQGNEMVLFRPPKPVVDKEFTEDLPAYLSLTPHEFEKLTMTEKRQWYQAHSRYIRELDQSVAEQKEENDVKEQLEAKPTEPAFEVSRRRSSSASSSRSYQVLGVPSTDEEEEGAFDDYGEDVEMMEDDEDSAAPKGPHAAGVVTHSEWFTDDEL
ncbi:hypothetical protein BBJ29_009643 [Phytophthora kernoviae]|uniref:Uncharacterized protein n=1 Tax=Phytophthora kernoviae TaxID=325452 RepID=A0A421FI33_9STRA|nr:hypothetical protein BBJ29_009643 [Phytophthora kernoviae]